MSLDTLATLTAEAKQFYERNLLFRAQQAQIFYQFGKKTSLPANQGNTVSWRRFNALPTNVTALTEGVTPSNTNLSVTEVTGTVNQYGNYVVVSDMLDMLAIDRVMTEATDVLGQNGGESIETVIRNVIQSGTSVRYATGSTRGGIAASNVLTLSLIRKAIADLKVQNARKFNGPVTQERPNGQGTYTLIVHPRTFQDLLNDTEIKNALQYGINNDKLFTGSMMRIYDVEIYESTLAPVFAGAGSGGANVYGALLFGQDAFGVVDVAGRGKYQLLVKSPGSAGSDDPLDQRGTIGWKAFQLPVILNNNFMVRIEHGATDG